MSELDRCDPKFVADLMSSDVAVRHVAAWLTAKGHAVEVPKIVVRPTSGLRENYSDNGDILIGQQRIEVKRRAFSFDGLASFPWDPPIIDVTHAYDKAAIKPTKYYLCSHDLTGALVVECEATFSQWSKRTTWDRDKGRYREFYVVAKALCAYQSFE